MTRQRPWLCKSIVPHQKSQETNQCRRGLGIGTTPSALISHGIDTTIVEIDPIVFDFAVKHFALPKKHTKVVADAVSYAAEAVVNNTEIYDYIVHDVFTGGAEPVDLFTLEFITDLYKLLKPGGVIAIVSHMIPCIQKP